MGDLIQNEGTGILGATNELDLVLSRGQGLFDVNFEDDEIKYEWSQRKICENHRDELSTYWDRYQYVHYFIRARKYSGRIKTCSIPDSIENHQPRPILEKKIEINKEEANAILKKEHLLVHIGLRE